MTTTTATATLAPAFDAPATDSYSETGRAGLLFLLTHGEAASWRLDSRQLQAAGDYASTAATAAGIDPTTVEVLAQLQRVIRGLLAGRRMERAGRLEALQALIDAEAGQGQGQAAIVAPAGGQGPSAGNGSGGGGGSKVPRQPKPKAPAPASWQPVPALALGADAF